jgi:hypothetical protein
MLDNSGYSVAWVACRGIADEKRMLADLAGEAMVRRAT